MTVGATPPTGEAIASAPIVMTRRAVMAGAMMGAAGTAAIMLAQRNQREVRPLGLGEMIPRTFAGWQDDPDMVPVLPDEAETASINRAYEETISRFYRRPDGAIVMLVVAHGRPDSGMLAIHRPATCYSAQGFTVTNSRQAHLPAPFAGVATDEAFATRGEREEPILSWVVIGGRQTGFGVTQKLEQLRAEWRGERADAILVRASTIGPDTPESYALLDRFAVDLLTRLSPTEQRLIAGNA